MTKVFSAVRRYPVVAMTILVAITAGIMTISGQTTLTQWLVSGFALIIAAIQLVDMVKYLMTGGWGIDVLAIIAIGATVAVGEYWASLVIVLMLSGGEALEDFAANRAQRELSSLLARVPQIAHRISSSQAATAASPSTGSPAVDDGSWEAARDIPVTDVLVGDELLVKPAEIVPVDGVLLSEVAVLDESSLTGESLPVDHYTGEAILSGAVNGEIAFTMRATALSVDSQYQRIVALVAEAAESRSPMVRLADRYAVPFTAVSLLIAGLAWLLSGDPVRFAEVLVVATPCPLLIAAPVAFLGGMSRAANAGIIVKDAGTLERLSRTKTVALDKTGTLTHGEPTVVNICPTEDFEHDELLTLVASAEQYSSHVLAQSLMTAAAEHQLSLREASTAREEATNGVVAVIDGRDIVVGKRAFIAEHAPDVVEASLRSGELAVYVAIDRVFAGSIVLSDQLRDNAAQTLSLLTELGVEHQMILTGDAAATAQYVGEDLGISDVRAELLPADKVDAVRAAPARPVVMVGDGVNDAPVLAAADVGIAMGAKGSTAASESADVVIMVDDLSRVARAVSISQRTTRVAIESIWLGIALSVGLMLVGAFGYLPAIVGAALQEVVDLAAILNALRALGRGRSPSETSAATPSRSGTTLTPV